MNIGVSWCSRNYCWLGADHLTFEEGWVIYGQQDFFSSNLVGRIFFYSSARNFFYYICAACNFFLPTSACKNFFFKITHPLPQELNGRPLSYCVVEWHPRRLGGSLGSEESAYSPPTHNSRKDPIATRSFTDVICCYFGPVENRNGLSELRYSQLNLQWQ